MREHLHKLFVRQAEHHATTATHHISLSKHHRSLADIHKADDGDGAGDLHAHIADAHEAMATEHASMGAATLACAKALQHTAKAFGMNDDALEPSPISRVVPDAPSTLRAIPRHGAPDISKLSLDPTLEKMFRIDGENA